MQTIQRLLQICIVSGIGAGVSIALLIAAPIFLGGIMQANPIGGLTTSLMFFLPLAILGTLIGVCSGALIGLLFGLVNVLLNSKFRRFRVTDRFNAVLASTFTFIISFSIYWRWLVSKAPLIDFASVPEVFG